MYLGLRQVISFISVYTGSSYHLFLGLWTENFISFMDWINESAAILTWTYKGCYSKIGFDPNYKYWIQKLKYVGIKNGILVLSSRGYINSRLKLLCLRKMTTGFLYGIIDLTLKWNLNKCTYLSQSLGVVGCTIFEDNLSAQIKKFSLDNLVITDERSYVVVLTV